MKIYKQKLRIADEQKVTIPKGSKILSVQEQFGEICIWFLCEPSNDSEYRKFMICGTGNPYFGKDTDVFIGTVQMLGGELVWHVFEIV